jgi:hypothetical protein
MSVSRLRLPYSSCAPQVSLLLDFDWGVESCKQALLSCGAMETLLQLLPKVLHSSQLCAITCVSILDLLNAEETRNLSLMP